MAKEARRAEESFDSVCGTPECQLMHQDHRQFGDPRDALFYASNNFTRKKGPGIPAKFVRDHGREIAMEVNLESGTNVVAVELFIGESGDDSSVRLGLGWEKFMNDSKFQTEDLLFFTLQGQSRLTIMPVRGHNRRRPGEEPHGNSEEVEILKPSEILLSDMLKLGASSRGKGVAKPERMPGLQATAAFRPFALRNRSRVPPPLASGYGASSKEPKTPAMQADLQNNGRYDIAQVSASDQGKQHVTRVSSHDALHSYESIMESSDSGNHTESDSGSDSDFDVQEERKKYILRHKRGRGASR